ncbi:hypothetical protein [Burkholderia stagnalis]|uniref:hypothetical protein n=1 Tax=Burkholderia stagnalis TaxID=1503054 RepID=UPI000F571195|nr:hypothetical protein [Burkholderia stagnalis]
MVDDLWMIIDLNETRIRTIQQVRAILDGTETLEFVPAIDARSALHMDRIGAGRRHHRRLKRASRGLVLRYLRRFSGFSRAPANRLARRWLTREKLVRPKGAPSNALRGVIPTLIWMRWPFWTVFVRRMPRSKSRPRSGETSRVSR